MTESRNLCRVDLGRALLLIAFLLLPITGGRWLRAAVRQDVDPPSEVWTALAYDWHTGVPYRPLLSEYGYGGTRYFPGHVALQAAAMKFLPPVASGFAVTAIALLTLLLGGYGLLRQIGVPRALSAGGTCLALMSTPVQEAAVATRGDLLAAALALCGLYVAGVALAVPTSTRRVAFAGFLFALSWFTKWTSVAALLATAIVFWSAGQRRHAAAVIGAFAMCTGALLAAMQVVSHGRFLEIILLSATGRSSAADLFKTPYHLLMNFREAMALTIPPTLLALGCLFHREAPARVRFLFVYVALAFPIFVIVNMGYGATSNHMIELEAATALIVAAFASFGLLHRQLGAILLATCVLLIGTLLVTPELGLLRRRASAVRTAQYGRFLPAIESRRPVLSVYPLVPILLGERPYLLDHWMFGVVEAQRPGSAADLQGRLRREEFGSIVLTTSPLEPAGASEIDRWLTVGTAKIIADHYTLIWSAEYVHVLVARGQARM